MIKKIILNLVIIIGFFLTPWYFLGLNRSDINVMENIQKPLLGVILVGSCLLVYLNYKLLKRAPDKKWTWIIFELIGIVGVLYSGLILVILYLFRNCCGW